ncbi:DUF5682 family protein [Antrihabitans stalactiti]|uniref:Uncharacterized protein n=1 Tax=Antrihabitans stalactiti TaxID=2584121 RepID=A0A848KFP4_9NOCA|nr:DUF5682 family protein [Antrihabitans stalactiti]NMN97803.1 hypothetical protein [Antrihabitans stalactiti]
MTTRIYGIRHHGPGSAKSLRAALDEFDPDTILIEGPADADPLVALTASAEMIPPIALLAYVAAEPAKAAFWPFAVFSPEWQAMQWAAEHEVPAKFCDLPASQTLDIKDRHREKGDPLEDLAAAAGYDDAERWWDAIVESTSDAGTFDALNEAMASLRESTTIDERTLQREAYMRQTMRKALKDGSERLAVVCGAWHAPALNQLGPAAHDARLLKGIPKTKTSLTWVPWTHSRLATSSGYGAGITSPGWYHHLFTETDKPITRWLTKVARVLRTEDLPVSSAHIIEAARLTETLAAMRSRPLAGLSEVTEATRAVLCDGDEVLLELVSARLVVGEKLGAVPEETPTVPLDADLRAKAKTLRLNQEAAARKLDLDLRKDNDLAKSRLLHRLRLLGIGWGTVTASEVRSTGTFRESWTLEWQPEYAVAIVEASMWGTTVLAAAEAKVLDQANRDDATLGDLTKLLEKALVADLTNVLASLLKLVESAAALDHDVAHLLAAIPPLTRTIRYGDVRGTDATALTRVTDSLLVRISAGLPSAVTSLDDDNAAEMRRLIDDAHGSVMTRDDHEASEQWLTTLHSISHREDVHGLLIGRIVRLLRDADRITQQDSEARLSRALSVGAEPAAKAAWVDGFLSGGGLLLVHDRQLLRLIDDWLSGLGEQDFTDALPLLRRTFGSFDQGERQAVGQAVRDPNNDNKPTTATTLDEERGKTATKAVLEILGVS